MKVAVTSQGPELSSPVDPRFGRARFFLALDTESGESSAHDNSENLNAMQGAGVQSARKMTGLGVQAVITGHVGPNAFSALQTSNVAVYVGASGTVAEAVEQFKAGQLEAADGADVQPPGR